MASFEIILLLLGCMLASSVFGQVLPRVSLPLAQIALGAVVGTLVTQDPTEVLGIQSSSSSCSSLPFSLRSPAMPTRRRCCATGRLWPRLPWASW